MVATDASIFRLNRFGKIYKIAGFNRERPWHRGPGETAVSPRVKGSPATSKDPRQIRK